ncbi:hypothetical protein M5K25_018453 [Dendrobium thyrsiflorum]|uniref:Uncharacterized protein n=1 Tax=Dendrobium thyrsiflorum TaxID=117978 RepID=A0ABD0UID1_DENTH
MRANCEEGEAEGEGEGGKESLKSFYNTAKTQAFISRFFFKVPGLSRTWLRSSDGSSKELIWWNSLRWKFGSCWGFKWLYVLIYVICLGFRLIVIFG